MLSYDEPFLQMSAPREAVCGAREGEGEGGIERWLMLTSLPVMREREKGTERKRGREGVREGGTDREGGRERGRNLSYLSNLSIIIELILLTEYID